MQQHNVTPPVGCKYDENTEITFKKNYYDNICSQQNASLVQIKTLFVNQMIQNFENTPDFSY